MAGPGFDPYIASHMMKQLFDGSKAYSAAGIPIPVVVFQSGKQVKYFLKTVFRNSVAIVFNLKKIEVFVFFERYADQSPIFIVCLLYTSDAADE